LHGQEDCIMNCSATRVSFETLVCAASAILVVALGGILLNAMFSVHAVA
jgi:hypothetical protein